MYQKILVPYDGSNPSDKALEHAIDIAKMSRPDLAQVILLHVIAEYPVTPYIDRPARSPKTGETTTLTQYIREVYELMTVSAIDTLNKKKDEVKKTSNFEIEVKVSAGHVSETILKFAKQEKVDLIVIGNVGRSGISKFMTLGSVSRAVSEKATCPVMIIH
jgi:nucleotide-binding universal stress UspA family protein